MSDSSTFIFSFVDVVEDAGSWEAFCPDVKSFYCSSVYEVVSGTTIKYCDFGHFLFVKKEGDIDAILFTNIHGTYLRSLNQGRRFKLF